MLKRLITFSIIILILALISIYYPTITKNLTIKAIQPTENQENPKQTTQVLKIIDGDTLETKQGQIRLLGIYNKEV